MKIARREKYYIAAAVLVILGALVLQFFVFPFFESRKRYARGIVAKEQALEEILGLRASYKALQTDSSGIQKRLDKRQDNFTLFSFLENAASAIDIKNNIKYMKPSASSGKGSFKESLVEMKLEKVTLKQLTGYLQKIESPADIVSIRRISVQVNKSESGLLDAVLQVMTFLL